MLPKGFETKVMEILQGLAKLAQAVSLNCRPRLETPELFFLPSVEEVGPAELPPPQQKIFYLGSCSSMTSSSDLSYKEETLVFLCPTSALKEKTEVVLAFISRARLTTCSCNRSVCSCSTRSLPSSIVAIDSYGQS